MAIERVCRNAIDFLRIAAPETPFVYKPKYRIKTKKSNPTRAYLIPTGSIEKKEFKAILALLESAKGNLSCGVTFNGNQIRPADIAIKPVFSKKMLFIYFSGSRSPETASDAKLAEKLARVKKAFRTDR